MSRIIIPKEEFIKFVKIHLEQFPQCKIDEYIDIKYNNLRSKFNKYSQGYKDVKSRQQINALLNMKQNKIGLYHYHRLLQLLSKDIHFYNYFDLLKILKKSKFDDMQVYKFLQKYSTKQSSPICCGGHCKKSGGSRSSKRTDGGSRSKSTNGGHSKTDTNGNGRIDGKYCSRDVLFGQIFSIVFKRFFLSKKKIINVTNYLDIGCGDCKQTKVLGNAIGLPDSAIYGADISHWGGYNEEKRSKVGINIIGLKDDGILPFESESFCLVSTFMVLHHVRPLEKLLSEISRILKPNGYFFIREHDAMYPIDYMLCDIEHALYDVVQRNDTNFFNTYHGVYYDWIEWNYILKKYGFKYIYADYNSNSIYYNLTTNRSFYGVYHKI
jgi:SAM-dependent methyltransferase